MMRLGVTPRERRTILIGAAVVTALLLATHGWPRWRAWVTESRDAAAEMRGELATAVELLADTGNVHARLVAAEGDDAARESLLLDANSNAAAGSALVRLLAQAARSAGVELGDIQLGADTASGPLGRVTVRAEFTTDAQGLITLLLRLERGPVLVAITGLAVSQPEPALPAEQPEALDVRLTAAAIFARTIVDTERGGTDVAAR
jgi:hypothetical protein